MANELTFNVNVDYHEDVARRKGNFNIEDLLVTLATVKLLDNDQTIATSETAIDLGDISSRGLLILVNEDTSNYVEVKTGTSGTVRTTMSALTSLSQAFKHVDLRHQILVRSWPA